MEKYDFLILGAGGTGLAAAMYGARLGMKTLVLGATHGSELPIGGVITTTSYVENYPGFKKILGFDLAKNLEEHAREYDLVTIKNEKATEVKKLDNLFIIKTEKGEYEAKSILFATGTKWRKLEVPGSLEFENKGVNYCALCDAPLFKDKITAIVGGSDSAGKDALILAEHAKKVYIIYRGEQIHPEPITLKDIEKNDKIEIINNTNVVEVKGEKLLNSVIFDKEYNGNKELELSGLFIAIGHLVLSDLAEPLDVKMNEKKEIIIDHKTSETNVPGIYAAGDVTDKQFKQLITGVADGCTAAYSAFEYLQQNK
ncbi:FAD-dependent oxidoreductase [Candidatus Pacearchaeota archaeon]|nr:FAD-dependent oxidoreductase [Candidatus Pacearchaeota archaeon]